MTSFNGNMTPIEVDIWLSERIDAIKTQIGDGDFTGALQAIQDLEDDVLALQTTKADISYVDARTGTQSVLATTNILASFTAPQAITLTLTSGKLYGYQISYVDSEGSDTVFTGLITPSSNAFVVGHAYFEIYDIVAPLFLRFSFNGTTISSEILNPQGVNPANCAITIYEIK